VVVKRLHPEDAEDPSIVRMFVDESLLSLRLRHPNIVRADALGLIEGRHALVMEYLEGQPLHSVLRRCVEMGRRIPIELLAPAFADVLDGIHYAHNLKSDDGNALNVVHRDISPHNLFITTSGNLKLLDFGIAKTKVQENHTRTGLVKGKVAYMAPEQAHGTQVDRRADVWSAGVTLWEAIAGVRLFKGDNEAASLRMTLGGPIPSLQDLRDDVPKEIELIVMRALRREPADRFPTAAAMAHALRSWGERHGAPIAAPLRDLLAELFGREITEQRIRMRSLAAGGTDAAPISSSVPALTRRIGDAETNIETHVSTISDFVDKLQRDQRSAFRWMFLLVGFLVAVILVLGVAFATRGSDPLANAPAPRAAAALPIAARQAAAPRDVPRASVPLDEQSAPVAAALAPVVEAAAPSRDEPHARPSGPRQKPALRATEPERAPAAPTVAHEPTPAPAVPEPSVEYGFLTLDTTPWSTVTVDGKVLGQTPIVRAKLPAGRHSLLLVNGERNLSTSYQVTIEAGKTSSRRLGLD
jgi:serine/threonine-protein kinase